MVLHPAVAGFKISVTSRSLGKLSPPQVVALANLKGTKVSLAILELGFMPGVDKLLEVDGSLFPI
jgi:hypothetical protein